MHPGPDASLSALREIFISRTETLSEILSTAERHYGDESYLSLRLAPDMLPFGTQIAFACDQARNFGRFCQGLPSVHFDAGISTVAQARECLRETLGVLKAGGGDDALLAASRRVQLGQAFYCDLTGAGFVHDFLLPNFYFHLVTAYDILRAAGVPLGKKDFMRHLGPHLRPA